MVGRGPGRHLRRHERKATCPSTHGSYKRPLLFVVLWDVDQRKEKKKVLNETESINLEFSTQSLDLIENEV